MINIFSYLFFIYSELKHTSAITCMLVDTNTNDCLHTCDSSDLPSDSSQAPAPFSAIYKVVNQKETEWAAPPVS